MKKNVYNAITSMCIALASGQVCAHELWAPHFPGLTEGIAAGALPPPGLYGVLNNYWVSFDQYNNKGNKTGVKIDGPVVIPLLLWQTGIKVFGADYAMAVIKPYIYSELTVPSGQSSDSKWGGFNTALMPVILSWALPNDFHVKTALVINVDDASSSPGHPPSGGGLSSGNGFWTVQPNIGVSWLHNGWNLSMDTFYSYNYKNNSTDYKSGQELEIDYTVTKTIDKWTVGLGANQVLQVTNDSGAGAVAAGCPRNGGCKAENFGVGPLVAYQFGGLQVTAIYSRDVYTRNYVGGDTFNLRFSIPISF